MRNVSPEVMLKERGEIKEKFQALFNKCAGYFDEDWMDAGIAVPEEMQKAIVSVVTPSNKAEEHTSKSIILSFAYYVVLVQGGVNSGIALELARKQGKIIALSLILGDKMK